MSDDRLDPVRPPVAVPAIAGDVRLAVHMADSTLSAG
jgi:hypothetical protein